MSVRERERERVYVCVLAHGRRVSSLEKRSSFRSDVSPPMLSGSSVSLHLLRLRYTMWSNVPMLGGSDTSAAFAIEAHTAR